MIIINVVNYTVTLKIISFFYLRVIKTVLYIYMYYLYHYLIKHNSYIICNDHTYLNIITI